MLTKPTSSQNSLYDSAMRERQRSPFFLRGLQASSIASPEYPPQAHPLPQYPRQSCELLSLFSTTSTVLSAFHSTPHQQRTTHTARSDYDSNDSAFSHWPSHRPHRSPLSYTPPTIQSILRLMTRSIPPTPHSVLRPQSFFSRLIILVLREDRPNQPSRHAFRSYW